MFLTRQTGSAFMMVSAELIRSASLAVNFSAMVAVMVERMAALSPWPRPSESTDMTRSSSIILLVLK